MVNYLLVCRSLTYAQRTAKALEHAGIAAVVTRTPREISEEGCGYCVRISAKQLSQTLVTLKNASLSPAKIFLSMENGHYSEVAL